VNAGKFNGSEWFVWNMAYPQGKTVQVHVAYAQELDAGFRGWSPVTYVLRTGALWNGPIGRATVTMSTADGGMLVGPDPATDQRDALTGRFSTFTPTQDVNATYIGPANAAKLKAAQAAATAPGASASDLLASTNAVLDVLMGDGRTSGYLGSLYRQPRYLVDTYFTAAQSWTQTATDLEPANAAAWELLGDLHIIAVMGKGEGGWAGW